MLQALYDGKLIEPTGNKITATCPTCDQPVREKCGRIVVWHWAHVSSADCDEWAEPDTIWHREWQQVVPPERREVTRGPHRADMLTADGRVVEVQHSPIRVDDIEAREAFYGNNMIWIFDAIDAYKAGRLELYARDDGVVGFRWERPRKSLAACKATLLLDIGKDHLVHVDKIYPQRPFSGKGRFVTRARAVAYFNGITVSASPTLDPRHLYMATLVRHVRIGPPTKRFCSVCDLCEEKRNHAGPHDCGHDFCFRLGEGCRGACPDCTTTGTWQPWRMKERW
jgi:competence protein CoiA